MTKQFRRTIQLVFIYNVSWFCTSSGSRDMAMSHKIDRVFLFFLSFLVSMLHPLTLESL